MTDDLGPLVTQALQDERREIVVTPQHFARLERVLAAGRRRRERRRRAGLLVAAAVAGAVVLPGGAAVLGDVGEQSDPPAVTSDPEVTSAPIGGAGRAVRLPGDGVDVAMTGGTAWALSLGPGGDAVLQRWDVASVQLTGSVAPPGGVPGGLTLDGTRSVWVWAARPGEDTVFTEYDAATLSPLRTFTYFGTVKDAVAGDGALWFALGSTVVRVPAGSTRRDDVGLEAVTSLAFDAGRGQVYAASHLALAAFDAATGRQLVLLSSGSRTQSLAVSGDGAVWFAGRVGRPSVVRLDPDGLATAATLPGWALLPGPVRLGGGRASVWVSTPDGTLTCVRPSDGRALERWTRASGPAASDSGGTAVAIEGATLRLLPLDRCPG